MARVVRPLLVAVILLLVAGDAVVLADSSSPARLIDAFLSDYEQALSEGNPFPLQRYDPGLQVFKPLLHASWFDEVVTSSVAISDRHIATLSPKEGIYEVSFIKYQEDIQRDGAFTRGIAGIKVQMVIEEGNLKVMSHRTFPPKVAVHGYASNDPRTWGEEHSLAERYLYRGLEYLREGDMKNSEEQIARALEMVQQGNYPKFLMGSAYFIAMTYYYSAMLKVKNGDFATAAGELMEALRLHPEYPAALNLRAEIHFSDAEYDQALELWQRSLAIHTHQDEVEEVAHLLTHVLGATRKKTRSLLLSLVNLPPSQAVQTLAPAVKLHPRNKVLVPLLAKAYLKVGDPEKALETLEGSRRVGKTVEITYLAARIQLALQRPGKALDLFEQVRELDPGFRDAAVFAVCLHASMGHFQEALAHLDMDTGGSEVGVLHGLKGKYGLMRGRFLDAVSELEQATQSKLPARVRSEVAYMLQRISRQRR